MDQHTPSEHIAIERWWPPLVAASKHQIQRNLDAALSEEVVHQIEAILGREIVVSEWLLTEREKEFIHTQGEAVD
jgi:hypothetical protein